MNGQGQRLQYLDNLRVVLTALVIAHHAAQPWVPGDWFVKDQLISIPLALFAGVNASFFMGAFFLVSGFFHPLALARKGRRGFVLDRLLRLGLPTLVYSLTVMPLVRYVTHFSLQGREPIGLVAALPMYFWDGFSFGHLWFVVMLLLFGLGYALLGPLFADSRPVDARAPLAKSEGWHHRLLLCLALVLGAATFAVRIFFPQNTWIHLPWPFALEPAHFPQYLMLFVLGIMAWRRDYFVVLPAKVARRWALYGALLPFLVLAPLMREHAFLGSGFTLYGLVAALREAFMCVGACAWLLVLFRDRFELAGPRLKDAARCAYGAYILQVPPLIFFQWLVMPLGLPVLVKFLLVCLGAVPASFLLARGLLCLPGVRRVL